MMRFGFAMAFAVILCAALPAGAGAQAGARQSAQLRFVESEPGRPSALTLSIDYVNPADPNAKPPAVRTVVEDLATGAQIDTSIPDRCPASDAQLMAQGAGACSAASRIGSGTIRIDTGLPDPGRFIDADVVFLNNTDQLIFLSTDRGTGARVVTRSEIRGGKVLTSAPLLPGTPPDGAAIDVVHVRLDEVSRQVGGARRGYITTPSECPGTRSWLNSVEFTYADGVSQKVATQSLCKKGGKRPGRCANDRNGSSRGDRFAGTGAGDRLFGFSGRDHLRGRGGRDCLHGGRGDDVLRGGRGRDRLFGGPGNDVCVGGPGRDRFLGCELIR